VHRKGKFGPFDGCSKFGSRDVLEQCTKGSNVLKMPAAQDLRKQFVEGSAAGKADGRVSVDEEWWLQ
jgi:hypothetical protein